jgi:carbamoyl-phosphate synthase large subunit
MVRLKEIANKVAAAFKITGPFNMQIIKNGDELKVIECNIRASRSFPFVSKVLGTNFIDVSTHALIGHDVPEPVDLMQEKRDYVATKVPQFSFTRLAGADPFLGVEMASTGEVACFGKDLVEAYWTSIQSTMNFKLPKPPSGILLGGDTTTEYLADVAKTIAPLGYKFFAATQPVKEYLDKSLGGSTEVTLIELPKSDKRKLGELFNQCDIRAVFNLAKARAENLLDEDYIMRRNAIDFGLPLFNEPRTALLFAKTLAEKLPERLANPNALPSEVKRWSEWIGGKPV